MSKFICKGCIRACEVETQLYHEDWPRTCLFDRNDVKSEWWQRRSVQEESSTPDPVENMQPAPQPTTLTADEVKHGETVLVGMTRWDGGQDGPWNLSFHYGSDMIYIPKDIPVRRAESEAK